MKDVLACLLKLDTKVGTANERNQLHIFIKFMKEN